MGNRASKPAVGKHSEELKKSSEDPLPPYIVSTNQTEEAAVEPDWNLIDERCLTAEYLKAISLRRHDAVHNANKVRSALLTKVIIKVISMKLSQCDMRRQLQEESFMLVDGMREAGIQKPPEIQWNGAVVESLIDLNKLNVSESLRHFRKMGLGSISLDMCMYARLPTEADSNMNARFDKYFIGGKREKESETSRVWRSFKVYFSFKP